MKRPPRKGEGRPSGYSSEMLTRIKQYLKDYEKEGDAIPSIAGLAASLQVSRDTIYEWKKDKEKKEFSDILDDILSTQERVLINKGLTSEFNSNITKLALGKHGYTDKTDVTSDGKVLPTPILASISSSSDDEKESIRG